MVIMQRAVYIPLSDYKVNERYSQYLAFLCRAFLLKEVSNRTKLYKSDFINIVSEKSSLSKRALKNIWEKGAYTNDSIKYVGDSRKCIILHTKRRAKIMIKVYPAVYNEVKSITDFKLFMTALQASRPTKILKEAEDLAKGDKEKLATKASGRGLKNIGTTTGTEYKETVCRRVSKAVSKFASFSKTNRYMNHNGVNIRLTNLYNFCNVVFVYNKFNTKLGLHNVDKSLKVFKQEITDKYVGKVDSNSKWLNSWEYEDFNAGFYA